MALELAHATWTATAIGAGAKARDLPEHEDPADTFSDDDDNGAMREQDPAGRAAQVRAFLAATDGETVST